MNYSREELKRMKKIKEKLEDEDDKKFLADLIDIWDQRLTFKEMLDSRIETIEHEGKLYMKKLIEAREENKRLKSSIDILNNTIARLSKR